MCYESECESVYYVLILITTHRRPRSIQNRAQEKFIHHFNNFLKELRIVFAIPKVHPKFTLERALKRQRRYLHGVEEQTLRFIPKVPLLYLHLKIYLCVIENEKEI